MRNFIILLMGLLALNADNDALAVVPDYLRQHCPDCVVNTQSKSGAYILEKGEEALMARAWLAQQAISTIDVQYFIWSTDNIGILAGEALLSAAERGVKVRVLVDDLLIDAKDKTMLALDAHPNVNIRIYNPKHSVGTSKLKRLYNVLSDFRDVNQRMHDKVVIFDNAIGITGGRNMADEYFDYNRNYNFRDRDVLLLGKVIAPMAENFEEFWNSQYAVAIDKLLSEKKRLLNQQDIANHYAFVHAYANDKNNFEPEVRQALQDMPQYFPYLIQNLVWDDIEFVSDKPGKNTKMDSLTGGGESTSKLITVLAEAQRSILIQTPYLVLPEGGIEFFAKLVNKGVSVKILTNSLASTDNLMAFSGYHKQRSKLLDAGIEIYEYKPHPAVQQELIERFPRIAQNNPIFAIHAKSMVVDDHTVFIGTFNLDPRSMNLNTEVGILANNHELAAQLKETIAKDLMTGNSWKINKTFNPDSETSWGKRIKLMFYKLLPLRDVL